MRYRTLFVFVNIGLSCIFSIRIATSRANGVPEVQVLRQFPLSRYVPTFPDCENFGYITNITFTSDLWRHSEACHIRTWFKRWNKIWYLTIAFAKLKIYVCLSAPSDVLTYWGHDKMASIFQTTFSNAFYMNENVWVSIKISLKFVPEDPIKIFSRF